MFKLNRVISAAYIAFGVVVGGAAVLAPPAMAQSNTTGTIYGQVPAGSTSVVIENLSTGIKRTLIPEASGRFQATALPPGRYRAQTMKGDVAGEATEVEVLLGQGAEARFGSTQLNVVTVTGSLATLDVSNTNNGSSFTSRQLEALPIARDVDSIIQLSPGTTKADPRYAGGASIGGGGASENSYYINGFPVTNALSQLGSIELPFSAIAQAQVLTGGFGAEFGRSVGGVVNITTKSGGNEWTAGGFASVSPSGLRASKRNQYYDNTGDHPDTDGTIYRYRKNDTEREWALGGYLSGPIIKDRLFFFFAGEQQTTDRKFVSAGATPTASSLGRSGWSEATDENTRYLAKFDWFLTQNHSLELTMFGDNYKTDTDFYGFSYATNSKFGSRQDTEFARNVANITPSVGGDVKILKYTGVMTDDLTVTALAGIGKSKHSQTFERAGGVEQVGNTSNGLNPDFAGSYFNPSALPYPTTVIGRGAKDTTKAFRLDFEYKLGRHLLRAGLDEVRLESKNAGDTYPGPTGGYWRYQSTGNPGFIPAGQSTPISAIGTPASDGRYYYARQRIFNDLTNANSDQSAQYIEDRWQITDRVLLTLGLRNESFKNKNGDGETFLESKNFRSPRAGASWDVVGDSSLKLFATAGRYSLQLPTQVAVRGASRSTFTDQFVTYTGIDPVTGVPTGTTSFGPPYSTNNEYGQPKDANTVAARDIKPSYQDELTVGIEKALSPQWNGGARVTYRKLKATIDDLCDYRPFERYAANNGITINNPFYISCIAFNPGQANRFLIDYEGNKTYTAVNLSAAELGYPKAERKYMALDFFLEHPFKDGWYGRINYTYSKSKGNTEGQTNSDIGQDDIAATITWDTPELMENKNGLLPNDRKHQIKAFGYYQIAPSWIVGANFLAASGRPKSCLGNYRYVTGDENDGGNLDYGSYYGYCAQEPSRRGSKGRLPWDFKVDGNLTYLPASIKGLAFRVDVFNLFNRQTIQAVDEQREVDYDPDQISPTYNRVLSYSTPRYMKFTVKYDHAF